MNETINQLKEDIEDAEHAVAIATNVFNETNSKYVDSAIYELLAAEMRLKELNKEYSQIQKSNPNVQ